MAEVEEGGAGSSLQALRRDTEGLADAMRQNVERVAQRGDNVDRLLEKGQQLDQSAQQFERVAVRTERRMLWRNRRMKLIIAAVVIVALLIATIAIAIAVHRGGGDGGGDGGGGGGAPLSTPSP
ncbi:vesicle-associated membrane protein 8-like [Lampetra fluviatilis]